MLSSFARRSGEPTAWRTRWVRGVRQTVEGRKWRYKVTLPRKVSLSMTILGHAASREPGTPPHPQSKMHCSRRECFDSRTRPTCHRHLTIQGRLVPWLQRLSDDISL